MNEPGALALPLTEGYMTMYVFLIEQRQHEDAVILCGGLVWQDDTPFDFNSRIFGYDK